jgi:phage I-like protein
MQGHKANTQKAQIEFIRLSAPAWSPADSGELPKELKLLSLGANATRKGTVTVGEKTKTLLPLNQRAWGFDRIALDFEHNTVEGTPAYKESREPRAVAAFGKPEIRADGLWLCNLQWTPEGQKNARNFADLSPCPKVEDGEVVFLHSVALCRQGAVDGLEFFSMDVPSNVEGEGSETQQETVLMEKIMALLRKALNLGDTATEEEVTAALQKTCDAGNGLTAMSADLKATKDQLVPLTADVVALKASTAKAEKAAMDSQRNLVCLNARLEGKVIPLSAEDLAKTDPGELAKMVAKLQPTVPVQGLTPLNVEEPKGTGAGAQSGEYEAHVKKLCGA